MGTCKWCGKSFDKTAGARSTAYCSAKCEQAALAAKDSSSSYQGKDIDSLVRVLKLLGIVFIAIVAVFTALCYKFPKFLAQKNKKFLYAYIIAWAVLAAGTVIYFSFFSPEAVSGIKTKIVSASCETEEKFVSILKEAASKESWTVIEGEEFTAYSQEALDVVKEREGKYATFKDSVYLVNLPDSVNVYVWFKTEDQATAYVYKTE
jgi:hypothetical protein